MPNRNYLRGREFEYRTIRMLAPRYVSYRMAGSHGEFDIIAFLSMNNNVTDGLPLIRAIQCKVGKSPFQKALKQIDKIPLPAIVSKELWHYVPRKGIFIYACEGGEWKCQNIMLRTNKSKMK